MKVRDVLQLLPRTRQVLICDFDENPLEEGSVGGLLEESLYLKDPVVYEEDDFPYLIMVGIPM